MHRRLIAISFLVVSVFINAISISSLIPAEEKTVSVEIKGEVERPGVYEFINGSTLKDLFDEAILTECSDTGSFYLDDVLYQSEVVVVPKISEKKLISINSADAEELCLLPGIGMTIALRIIEYRKDTGSFLALEDLMNVKGIGHGKFERIRELITL